MIARTQTQKGLIAAGTVFVTVAAALDFLSSQYIAITFPNRVPVDDLLFRLTPYLSWTQYLSDAAAIIGPILLGWYIFNGREKYLPRALFSIGLGYLMRASMIILTPLGGPLGNGALYGFIPLVQNGQIPSGHTMLAMLCYLFVDRREAPRIKALLLLSVGVEILSLILSRGHYGIDIAVGLLVAYVAYHESPRLIGCISSETYETPTKGVSWGRNLGSGAGGTREMGSLRT